MNSTSRASVKSRCEPGQSWLCSVTGPRPTRSVPSTAKTAVRRFLERAVWRCRGASGVWIARGFGRCAVGNYSHTRQMLLRLCLGSCITRCSVFCNHRGEGVNVGQKRFGEANDITGRRSIEIMIFMNSCVSIKPDFLSPVGHVLRYFPISGKSFQPFLQLPRWVHAAGGQIKCLSAQKNSCLKFLSRQVIDSLFKRCCDFLRHRFGCGANSCVGIKDSLKLQPTARVLKIEHPICTTEHLFEVISGIHQRNHQLVAMGAAQRSSKHAVSILDYEAASHRCSLGLAVWAVKSCDESRHLEVPLRSESKLLIHPPKRPWVAICG